MRKISETNLWLGNIGDVDDLSEVFDKGIAAIVDLAMNEAPIKVNRDLVYCRYPLLDSPGNPSWIIKTAVDTVVDLIRAEVPSLIFCSAGLSRSPLIAGAALAKIHSYPLSEAIKLVAGTSPMDLPPGLFLEVQQSLGLS